MKLAIFTEFFHPHVGGQERRYFELSRRLVARGHEVTIYTIKYAPDLPTEDTLQGIEVKRYAATANYAIPNFRNPIGVLKFSLATVARALSRADSDYCLFNQWPVSHIPIAEPFCGSKTLVDWCEIWPGFLPMMLWRYVSQFPDAHTVVDQHLKTILTDQLGVDPRRVAEIKSGVDTKRYLAQPSAKEKGMVIYVGRLMPHKRLNLLLEAIKLTSQTGADVHLHIVGGGPSHTSLRQMAASFSDRVTFHGETPEELKVSFLKKAWLMVIPSKREGVPLAAVEAIAARVPVLTVDSPANGTQHLVRRHHVGVVCQADPRAIAHVMSSLYNDDGQMLDLSESCSRAATFYDWDNIAGDLEAFLNRGIHQ